MEIKKTDAKGRILIGATDTHYFITSKDGEFRLRPVPVVGEIPEGYEPAEVSAAKDVVLDSLYVLGVDEFESIDLIRVADRVVEDLLKFGVEIPESES